MATCMVELYLWSLKQLTTQTDQITGLHTYHEKSENTSSTTSPYLLERKAYDESRNLMWTPKNRRPERLRDLLKDMEEFVSQNECVQITWITRRLMQVVLNNGCITSFYLNCQHGDVERIFIDRSLVGKISTENVSHMILNETFMMVAHGDKTRLDYIYFSKRTSAADRGRKIEKLANMDPKTIHIELPGNANRRLKRQLSVNSQNNMVLVWWPSSANDVWPWSPVNRDSDRSNLIFVTLDGTRTDIITSAKTEFDPIHVSFSAKSLYDIHTIEMLPSATSEIRVNVCTYQITNSKVAKSQCTTIPLKSHLISHDRNPSEDRMLLGCEDCTIVLCNTQTSSTIFTKADVVPNILSWHPTGTIFLTASSRGDIQVFDVGLNRLKLWLVAEQPTQNPVLRLSALFTNVVTLKQLKWCPSTEVSTDNQSDNSEIVAVAFDKGPIGVMMVCTGKCSNGRLSTVDLTREYVKHKQYDEAVNVLCTMSWDTQGPECYSCLSILMNHLLKMPLNADREGQMQAVLGSFYAPKISITDKTIMEYRDPISRLARRFFHHLLRYARFDKAFLLAVDIGARDLFMDIHYMALDRGETTLAEVAYTKAEEIECISGGSSSLEDFESEEDIPIEEETSPPQFTNYDDKILQDHSNQLNYSYKTPTPQPPADFVIPEKPRNDYVIQDDGSYMEDIIVETSNFNYNDDEENYNPNDRQKDTETNVNQKTQPADIVGAEIPIDNWTPNRCVNSQPVNGVRHDIPNHTVDPFTRLKGPEVTSNDQAKSRSSIASRTSSQYDVGFSQKVASNNRYIERNMSDVGTNYNSISNHFNHKPVLNPPVKNVPPAEILPHESPHFCCLHNSGSDHHDHDCRNNDVNRHMSLSQDNNSQHLGSVSPSSYKDSEISMSSYKDSSYKDSSYKSSGKGPSLRTPNLHKSQTSDMSPYSHRHTPSDISLNSQRVLSSDASPSRGYNSASDSSQRSKQKRWSVSDVPRYTPQYNDMRRRVPSVERIPQLNHTSDVSHYPQYPPTDVPYTDPTHRCVPNDTSHHNSPHPSHHNSPHLSQYKHYPTSSQSNTPTIDSTNSRTHSYNTLHTNSTNHQQRSHRRDRTSPMRSPAHRRQSMSPIRKSTTPSSNRHTPSQRSTPSTYRSTSSTQKSTSSNRRTSPSTNRRSSQSKDRSPSNQMSPPANQVYPPSNQMSPPNQVYPPSNQMSPPTNPLYPSSNKMAPPSNQVYPPSNQMFPPSNQIYPPSNQMSPPTTQVYPPSNHMSPPPNQVYPPSNQMSPPTNQIYPSSNQMSPPSNQVYPPSNQMSPPPNQIYPPSNQIPLPSNQKPNQKSTQSKQRSNQNPHQNPQTNFNAPSNHVTTCKTPTKVPSTFRDSETNITQRHRETKPQNHQRQSHINESQPLKTRSTESRPTESRSTETRYKESHPAESRPSQGNGHRPLSRQKPQHMVQGESAEKSRARDIHNFMGGAVDKMASNPRPHHHKSQHSHINGPNNHKHNYIEPAMVQKVQADLERAAKAKVIHFDVV